MSVNIGSLAVILKGDMSPLYADLRAAKRAVADFGKSIPGLMGSGIAGGAKGLFGAGVSGAKGLYGSASGIAQELLGPQSIMGTIKQLAHEAHTAENLGLESEQFGVLAHAARMSGLDVGELEHGIRHLQRTLGGAGLSAESTGKKLEDFGLDSRKLSELPTYEKILEIADGYKDLGASASKAGLATAAAGRGGQAFGQFFEAIGKGGIRQFAEDARMLGMVMTKEQSQEIVKAKNSVLEMESAFTGLKRQLAIAFAPLVSQIGAGFKDWLKDIGGIPGVAKTVANAMLDVAEVILGIIKDVRGLINDVKGAPSNFWKSLVRGVTGQTMAYDLLGQGVGKSGGLDNSGFDRAQKQIKAFRARMNELLKGGPEMGVFSGHWVRWAKTVGESVKDVITGITALENETRRAIETFGLDADQLKIHELIKKGATDGQIAKLRELVDIHTQLKKGEEDWQKAAQLANSLKGPADKFKDAIREADNLREDVKLSENEWIRARGKAAMDLASQFGPQGLPTAILQGSAEALSAVNRAQSASDKQQNPFKTAEEILKRLEEIDRQMLATLKQQAADANVLNRPGLIPGR